MENEKKTIGIDQQIEAVQDMMPVIDKASKEVFEEVIKSLQFAKASGDYFKSLCDAFADENSSAEQKEELAGKAGETLFESFPEWAKQTIVDGIDDTAPEKIFAAIHGTEIKFTLGQSKELNPDQQHDNAVITDEQKAEVKAGIEKGIRYVRKHNRFTSGVRRFGIDVMTNDTYPNFKFIRFKNEAERDDEFLNLLTVESTKEYPEPEKE